MYSVVHMASGFLRPSRRFRQCCQWGQNLTFSYTGSGASAFLTRIDDVANEGGAAAKKNWQLWVNTSYADKSFGVYEVQPLDVVFWRFTTQAGK